MIPQSLAGVLPAGLLHVREVHTLNDGAWLSFRINP